MKLKFVVHDRGDSSVGMFSMTESIEVDLGPSFDHLSQLEIEGIEETLCEALGNALTDGDGGCWTSREWNKMVEAEYEAARSMSDDDDDDYWTDPAGGVHRWDEEDPLKQYE